MKKKKLFMIISIALCSAFVLFMIFFSTKNYKKHSSVGKESPTIESLSKQTETVKQEKTTETERIMLETIAPTVKEESISSISMSNIESENTNNQLNETRNNAYVKPTQEPTYSESEINRNKWKDFSITINSISLRFPIKIGDLNKLEYDFTKVDKKKKLNFDAIDNPNLYKNGKDNKNFINIYITNDSEISLPYSQCKVIGMNVNFENTDELDFSIEDFHLKKGIKKEQIISFLGEPTQSHNTNSIETITYSSENSNKYWNFGFKNDKLIGFNLYVK